MTPRGTTSITTAPSPGRESTSSRWNERTAWRKDFFYEHIFEHPRLPKMEGVRTEGWKYIRYVDGDPTVEELYDLRRNPQELENLAGRPSWAGVLTGLRESWAEWRE